MLHAYLSTQFNTTYNRHENFTTSKPFHFNIQRKFNFKPIFHTDF